MKTEEAWSGSFGDEYTIRNLESSENKVKYLQTIAKDTEILEVGCNVGNQLKILHDMGYTNLHGIDICRSAISIAKEKHLGIKFQQASLLDLPFNDNEFDLVFSSGVLIHIHPKDLPKAMSEMHRCSKQYIYGYEYFRPICKGYNYRNEGTLCWRNNFLKLFLKQFLDLKLIKKKLEMRNIRDWRMKYLLELKQ